MASQPPQSAQSAQNAEKALSPYIPGTRAWFPHKDAGWTSATLDGAPQVSDSGQVTLSFQDDATGESRTLTTTLAQISALVARLDKEGASLDAAATASGALAPGQLPPLRNPPLLETTDDLTNLSHLNEPSILHTILTRYGQRFIYTYSGIVLIAVNPFDALNLYSPEMIKAYSGRKRGELEPHLFAIAEDAYRYMIRDEKDQTIVVSGESCVVAFPFQNRQLCVNPRSSYQIFFLLFFLCYLLLPGVRAKPFQPSTSCATLLVWSKIPLPSEARRTHLKRPRAVV